MSSSSKRPNESPILPPNTPKKLRSSASKAPLPATPPATQYAKGGNTWTGTQSHVLNAVPIDLSDHSPTPWSRATSSMPNNLQQPPPAVLLNSSNPDPSQCQVPLPQSGQMPSSSVPITRPRPSATSNVAYQSSPARKKGKIFPFRKLCNIKILFAILVRPNGCH
ncbi:hypothetical protein BC833DRAFT_625402 [Globomyces pollinis-pini]|nr:hypothetical protein BC833DRAFT_625402 [Globomyces pollinis-pini]